MSENGIGDTDTLRASWTNLFRGKSNERRVPLEVHFDSIKHYPLSNPTQRHCSYCSKKSKHICLKSYIRLNIDCFESYHENVKNRFNEIDILYYII